VSSDGTPQESKQATAQAQGHRTARHTVQLSILQPREVLRGEDGPAAGHRHGELRRVPRGLPDHHQLPLRTNRRLHGLGGRLRIRQPIVARERFTAQIPTRLIGFDLFIVTHFDDICLLHCCVCV